MKKSLLALAIASIAASSVASAATVYDKDGTKVDVYGRLQSVWYSVNSGAGLTGYYEDNTVRGGYNDNSIATTARLGLNVRQEVMPGLAAYGNVEWEASGTTQDHFTARYAFAGLDFGQYGKVQIGHFDHATKYVLVQTDIFDDWGCYGQYANDRNSSLIGYSWSGYGFDVNAIVGLAANGQHVKGSNFAYQVPGAAAGTVPTNLYNDSTVDVNSSYGLSVGYTSVPVVFGPISVRAGWEHFDFQQSDDVGLGASPTNTSNYFYGYDHYAVSASWGNLSSGFYVAALYNNRTFEGKDTKSHSAQDVSLDGFEVALGYSFANGVTTRIGYNYTNYDNGVNEADGAVIPVYVNYQLSPAFNVWAEARFDVGTDDGLNNEPNFEGWTGLGNLQDNIFSVGARYTF